MVPYIKQQRPVRGELYIFNRRGDTASDEEKLVNWEAGGRKSSSHVLK